MNSSEAIRALVNAGGYAFISTILLLMIRELMHKFLNRLIFVLKRNTSAQLRLARQLVRERKKK